MDSMNDTPSTAAGRALLDDLRAGFARSERYPDGLPQRLAEVEREARRDARADFTAIGHGNLAYLTGLEDGRRDADAALHSALDMAVRLFVPAYQDDEGGVRPTASRFIRLVAEGTPAAPSPEDAAR